jgi:cell division protein ZapA
VPSDRHEVQEKAMAQVAVTIAGRTYRIACDDGDESRLAALAEVVDSQVAGMRQRFGEIGDRRLLVMAAVAIADELVDMSRRVRDLEAVVAKLEADAAAPSRPSDRGEHTAAGVASGVAARIEAAAEQIERIARDLDAAGAAVA